MIHHQIDGNQGEWLVFVHGLTCANSDWKHQIDALSTRYRCLSVDLRGHGQSASLPGPYDMETLAADVVVLLHELSVGRAVLIGHSMGTRVIAAAAIQAPQRVAGLVFVDGSQQGLGDPIAARDGMLAMLGDEAHTASFANKMFEKMFTEKSNPADRELIVKRAGAVPYKVFCELISNMACWDAGRMQAVLEQLKIPLAVVQSSRVTPERERFCLKPGESTPYLDLVRRSVPHASIQVVPDIGHFTQLDAPQSVNEAIEAVMGRLDA
ncbi:MAG: alpha/beta fold hydrolase [Burkholderiaceae bacterium]